jgi:hypothetical protein
VALGLQSVTLHFVFMLFVSFSVQTVIIFLNCIKHLILVIAKYGISMLYGLNYLRINRSSLSFKVLRMRVSLFLLPYASRWHETS